MGKIKNMLMEKRPSLNERRIPHGGSSKMFSVTFEISLNADKYNLKTLNCSSEKIFLQKYLFSFLKRNLRSNFHSCLESLARF